MTNPARGVVLVAICAACGSFQADEGDGSRTDGGATPATPDAGGANDGSTPGDVSSCDGAPAELAEEFSAPSFGAAWTPSASGAVSEVDTASSLSPPQSMRTRKIAPGDSAASAFLRRVLPGAAKSLCVDFAFVQDSFGSQREDNELTIFGLALEAPGSGLKNYELSLVLEASGHAAIVEHADSETGQPDVVNQRHPITGSSYWATGNWTSLSLRVALEKNAVELRAGGNLLVKANLQAPPATQSTEVRVGVVREGNALGSSWTVHHDNVYVRFGR